MALCVCEPWRRRTSAAEISTRSRRRASSRRRRPASRGRSRARGGGRLTERECGERRGKVGGVACHTHLDEADGGGLSRRRVRPILLDVLTAAVRRRLDRGRRRLTDVTDVEITVLVAGTDEGGAWRDEGAGSSSTSIISSSAVAGLPDAMVACAHAIKGGAREGDGGSVSCMHSHEKGGRVEGCSERRGCWEGAPKVAVRGHSARAGRPEAEACAEAGGTAPCRPHGSHERRKRSLFARVEWRRVWGPRARRAMRSGPSRHGVVIAWMARRGTYRRRGRVHRTRRVLLVISSNNLHV